MAKAPDPKSGTPDPLAVAEAAGAVEVDAVKLTDPLAPFADARVVVEPAYAGAPGGDRGAARVPVVRAVVSAPGGKRHQVRVTTPVLLDGELRGLGDEVDIDGRTFAELSAAGAIAPLG